MGEGNFGGDGSVKWDVKVEKQGRFNGGNNNPGGPRNSDGTDDEFRNQFEISVKPPDGKSADEFLQDLKNGGMTVRGNQVRFNLPVERKPQQIKIEW
jgi:hypothetical protein